MATTRRSPPPGKASPGIHTALSDPALSSHSKNQEPVKDLFVNLGRRTRRRLGDDGYEGSDSDYTQLISEITKLFTSFEVKQNQKFDCLKSTMTEISEQNAKIQASVEFVTGKYDELLERLEATERENFNLKKQMCSLEIKIDHLERSSRSAMLEISNLPITATESKESLTSNLCKIGAAINQEIKPSDVKNIYRLKKQKDLQSSGTVVAEFHSSDLKVNVLKATKMFNKQNGNHKLSTATMELPGPRVPIYVTESLTTYGKHLYYLCRKLQKEGKCDGCWSSFGKVYVKKTASSVPFCVNSESDLKKLVSTALWLTPPTFIVVLLFDSQNCLTFFVKLHVLLFNQHFTSPHIRHAKQTHSSDTYTRLHYTKQTHSHDSDVNSYYTFPAKIFFVLFTQHVQTDALKIIKFYFTDTVNDVIFCFGLFFLTLNNTSYLIR